MIVPDHWAEARKQHRSSGRQVTVRRYGWSTVSEADALAMAETRADEALRRILTGEKVNRREPKVAYNGASGVPIREEVLAGIWQPISHSKPRQPKFRISLPQCRRTQSTCACASTSAAFVPGLPQSPGGSAFPRTCGPVPECGWCMPIGWHCAINGLPSMKPVPQRLPHAGLSNQLALVLFIGPSSQ